MFDFIAGYILGSSTSKTAPLGRKAIWLVMVALVFLSGVFYMTLPLLFSESAVASDDQCSGAAAQVLFCELEKKAFNIGMTLVCLAAILAVACGLLALIASKVSPNLARGKNGHARD